MSQLLIHDVPIECINEAAMTYYVPAVLIIAILKTEGGRNGLASKNKDGSYDYGPMQINSRWLKKLAQYGYTQYDLQHDPCKNVTIGTWILATNIANGRTTLEGVGNYHSRTPRYNQRYRTKVKYYHNWLNKIINPTTTPTLSNAMTAALRFN